MFNQTLDILCQVRSNESVLKNQSSIPLPSFTSNAYGREKYCYQCGKPVVWLAPDSRCSSCTRYTSEEITGKKNKGRARILNDSLLPFFVISTIGKQSVIIYQVINEFHCSEINRGELCQEVDQNQKTRLYSKQLALLKISGNGCQCGSPPPPLLRSYKPYLNDALNSGLQVRQNSDNLPLPLGFITCLQCLTEQGGL